MRIGNKGTSVSELWKARTERDRGREIEKERTGRQVFLCSKGSPNNSNKLCRPH